jgi:hypothetical protein
MLAYPLYIPKIPSFLMIRAIAWMEVLWSRMTPPSPAEKKKKNSHEKPSTNRSSAFDFSPDREVE